MLKKWDDRTVYADDEPEAADDADDGPTAGRATAPAATTP